MFRWLSWATAVMTKRSLSIVALTLSLVVEFLPQAGLAAHPQATSEVGVVVEAIGPGSALGKAGIEPGDILVGWERLPNPPANPEGARGEIGSVFDWEWLKVEQAPRGVIRLNGRRGKEERVFHLAPGLWGGRLRPTMPEAVLDYYHRETTLTESPEPVDHRWRTLAEFAKSEGGQALSCWILLRLGESWIEARNLDRARQAFRSALEVASDSRTAVTIWQSIGAAYEGIDELKSSQEAFVSALQIWEQIAPGSLGVAFNLTALGRTTFFRGHLGKSENFFLQALAIHKVQLPDSLHMATSLNNLGNIALRRGNLINATVYHEYALKIRHQLAPESIAVADSLSNLAILADMQGQTDKAIGHGLRSLEIFQNIDPDGSGTAIAINNLGIFAFNHGNLQKAEMHYRHAMKLWKKLAPGSRNVGHIFNNLGRVAYYRGDLMQAINYYEQALEIYQQTEPNGLDVADIYENIANVELTRGDLEKAEEYHRNTFDIRKEIIPRSLPVAMSLNNLGIVAGGRSKFQEAAAYFEESLELRTILAPETPAAVAVLSSLGSLALARGDSSQAQEFFNRALDLGVEGLDAAHCLHNLGNIAFGSGELSSAYKYHQDALQVFEKLAPGSLAEAQALYALGRVHAERSSFTRPQISFCGQSRLLRTR